MLALALGLTMAAAPLNVAVLYFDNDSGKREYDVLKKGLADMLLTDLAAVPSLQVVERDRLDQVLKEQQLQRGSHFDRNTAVRVGKLMGASHAVTGSIMAIAPQVRLDVRMFSVETGAVMASGSVTGAQEDLFGLEQKLVAKLLAGLDAKLAATDQPSGKMSLAALAKYGEGVDLADKGDLVSAQSKLGEVVRESPDFTLAKHAYAEMIKQLRAAQKQRGSELDAAEVTLQQHIDAWRAKKLSQLHVDDEVMHYFGYLHAQCHLQLFHLKKLLGAANTHDEILWVPPGKRAEVMKTVQAWLEGMDRLIADNREYRKKGRARNKRAELSDEDKALGEQVTGKDLGTWSFSSASSLGIDAAELLLMGRSPWNSEIDRFSMRPSPVQLDPALRARANAFADAAVKELPLDSDADEVAQNFGELQDTRAEGYVLEGKTEDAVAQWQLFLDKYPKHELFPLLSRKIENAMLISEEVETAQKLLDACDPGVEPKLMDLAKRIGRNQGAAGLMKLCDRLNACAKKQKAPWEGDAFLVPAQAALAIGDCPSFISVRAKAIQAKRPLPGDLTPKLACDAP